MTINAIVKKDVFLLGVNYWPGSSGLDMWTEWNPDEIIDDIKRMKTLGMNSCRPFLYMPAFTDKFGKVIDLMLQRLHFFMEQCELYELATFPTFIVGHMSGEDWDVEWNKGYNFITDSETVKICGDYIQHIVREIKDYSYLTGWLLSNELPNYIGSQKPEDVEVWAEKMISIIHSVDVTHPISIGDGAWSPEITSKQTSFILRKLNKFQDFVGLHYYPRAMSPWHHSYTSSFRLRLAREWNRPVIVEEFGTSTTLTSEDNQAAYYRSVLFSSLINGAKGAFSWCLNDFDFENKRPYSHHTFEERFGVVRTDKSLKPAADEFRKFSRIANKLIQNDYKKIERSVALFIPSNYYYHYPHQFQPEFTEWYDLYLETFSLLKRANIDVRMLYEPAQEIEREGLYSHELILDPEEIPIIFIPRMKLMTKRMRIQLEEYIRNGGTVYFSFANDSWVLDWHKLAGIEMDCKFGVPDFYKQDFLKIRNFNIEGSTSDDKSFHIPLKNDNPELSYCSIINNNGETILEDENGYPFLIKNTVGKGQVYFNSFPIEMLALKSNDDSWKAVVSKMYKMISEVLLSKSEFTVSGDGLEMGVWNKDNEYHIIIINHAWDERLGMIQTLSPNWEIIETNIPIEREYDQKFIFRLGRKNMCYLVLTKKKRKTKSKKEE